MATKPNQLMGELADASTTPQKFIRTFAGDAEALKRGTEPDLMPYGTETADSVDDSLYAAKAHPVPPPPVVTPEPPPSEVSPQVPIPKPIASPRPVPPPPPPVVTPEPPQSEPAPYRAPEKPSVSNNEDSPIETYSSDFSDHVNESGASAFTVLAAEQDAGRQATAAPSHTVANVAYISLSIVLLLVGALGAYEAYLRYEQGRTPVTVAQTVSAPIFVDERQQISGSGLALEQAVVQSVATSPTEGKVRLLYTTDATSTSNNIFIDMQLAAPGMLVRNLAPAGSMAGVTTVSGVASPFFILPVTSYADTFAAMLAWEPTMPESMQLLYPPYPIAGTASSTTATSSAPAASAMEPVGTFTDKIVANHNTREYKDASGRTILLYGYWNQSTLLIARNEAVFTEIVGRLANSRSGS